MIERKRRITRDIFPNSRTEKHFFYGKTLLTTLYPLQTEKTKFTVIASKKTLKLAVERNAFKRLVYEVVRKHEYEFDIQLRGKVVFSLKKGGLPPTFQSIEEDIAAILSVKKQ